MSVLPNTRDVSAEIERLYMERYSAFCRMAWTVTGNLDSAHDSVQEGFARALARRREFRGEGALEGWVWRIVLRAALDSRRNGSRVELRDSEEIAAREGQWAPELPHPERDAELVDALRALPERQRLVAFLRYFADLTHADIAAITGMRLGTVSATLSQAKASLAKRLGLNQSIPKSKEKEVVQ